MAQMGVIDSPGKVGLALKAMANTAKSGDMDLARIQKMGIDNMVEEIQNSMERKELQSINRDRTAAEAELTDARQKVKTIREQLRRQKEGPAPLSRSLVPPSPGHNLSKFNLKEPPGLPGLAPRLSDGSRVPRPEWKKVAPAPPEIALYVDTLIKQGKSTDQILQRAMRDNKNVNHVLLYLQSKK